MLNLCAMKQSNFMTTTGLIAGLYAALTIFLAPISFGPLQIRVAEALTVLPYLMPQAIWGLWIGCMVANIYGGLGPIDIFGGSFITLLAAGTTYFLQRFDKPVLAPLPPVLWNAFGVSAYLHLLIVPPKISFWRLSQLSPYFLFVILIGLGELVACYGLGYPLLLVLKQRFDFIGERFKNNYDSSNKDH